MYKEEKQSIEQQIEKLITSTEISFRLGSKIQNVSKVEYLYVLEKESGDFRNWNTEYHGYAKLSIADENGGYPTEKYDIHGYANVENNTVTDIDKIISIYKPYQ